MLNSNDAIFTISTSAPTYQQPQEAGQSALEHCDWLKVRLWLLFLYVIIFNTINVVVFVLLLFTVNFYILALIYATS